VNIQLPPLGLVTPITLPFNSTGFLIFGDAMMLSMSLLIAGDKYEIGTFGGGTEDGSSDGALLKLGLPGCEGGHSDRTAADVYKRQVQAITPEETVVLCDVHSGLVLTERAGCHDHFGRCLRRCHSFYDDSQQQRKQNKRA
jgi:hypothetical protein